MNKKNKYYSLGYYQILDVSFSSSDDEIRQKYRELAKFWHPDHNTDSKAVDMFQKISIAYDVLKDPKLKLKYTLLSIIYNSQNFPALRSAPPLFFRIFRRWIKIANLKYQFNEKSQCYKVHDILLAFRCHSIL